MIAVRSLPMRVDILAEESVDSWVEAVGRRYDVSMRRMLIALGMTPPPVTIAALLTRVEPAHWRAIEEAAGLAPGRLDTASAGSGGDRLLRRSRFCPQCLAERAGRWPLFWRQRWTVACLHHRVLLLDACRTCQHPPRRLVPGGFSPLPIASCAHIVDGMRCGADLTSAPAVEVGAEVLAAQHWVDELLLADCSDQADHAAALSQLRDLPTIVSWLLHHHGEHLRATAEHLAVPYPPADPEGSATHRMGAAVTAAALDRVRVLVGAADEPALQLLAQLLPRPDASSRSCPPGMDGRQWVELTGRFPNRYLRTVDRGLPDIDRLRFSSSTPAASLPTTTAVSSAANERVPQVPQLLWPDWTARLLPATGIAADRLRSVGTVCLLLPGSTRGASADAAKTFAPRLGADAGVQLLMAFGRHSGGSFTNAVLTVLCRIAEHLDTVGSAIDYQRRRDQLPSQMISWEQWRELAYTAGGHPGDAPDRGRHLQAQRYLYQLLCGADLLDPRHGLAFRSPPDRGVYVKFLTALPTPLRAGLHDHAQAVLTGLGIDEPLTWSPPDRLADGLVLPGITNLDVRVIQRQVIEQGRPPGEVADALGVHIEHIRIALEGLDRPPRQWKRSAAPLVWQDEQRAARQLTPAFFRREQLAGRGRLADLVATTGLPRKLIARYAKKHGVDLGRAPIDPDWLRDQYVDQCRSVTDIASELGVSQATVSLALRRHGIPARPMSVRSRPQMIAALPPDIPPDVRAAVEGGLDGWQRLRRFQTAVKFPSLQAAAKHLNASPAVLVTQMKRLEHDVGETLLHRAAPGRPQHPSERGRSLLQDLDRDSVRHFLSRPADARLTRAAADPRRGK